MLLPGPSVGLLFLLSLAGLVQAAPPARVDPPPSHAVMATIEHDVTNGWDYYREYSVAIYEDGTVRFDGPYSKPPWMRTPAERATSTKKLSKEQMGQIAEAFERADYFALKELYAGPNRDGDVGPLPENITTSYTREGRTKKVTHDVGTYVRRLSEMEVRIEKILGTRDWAAHPR